MSRPLVLEITVDDKGNAVLKDMRGNEKFRERRKMKNSQKGR